MAVGGVLSRGALTADYAGLQRIYICNGRSDKTPSMISDKLLGNELIEIKYTLMPNVQLTSIHNHFWTDMWHPLLKSHLWLNAP